MTTVDFDHIEAGLNGTLGSFGISVDHGQNFALSQRARCRVAFFGRNLTVRYRPVNGQPFRLG